MHIDKQYNHNFNYNITCKTNMLIVIKGMDITMSFAKTILITLYKRNYLNYSLHLCTKATKLSCYKSTKNMNNRLRIKASLHLYACYCYNVIIIVECQV